MANKYYKKVEFDKRTLRKGKCLGKDKNILNLTLVDFFIEPNICIYCDGDYWHSLPKAIECDKKINDILNFSGYKVIRLTETQINKDINYCEIIQNGI